VPYVTKETTSPGGGTLKQKRLNAQVAPDAPPNDRYSRANIAVMVVGTLLWLLVVAGMLLPDPDGAS